MRPIRSLAKRLLRPVLAARTEWYSRKCDQKLSSVLDQIATADLEQLRQRDIVQGFIEQIGLARDTRGIYGGAKEFMNPIPRGFWQIPRQLAEFSVLLSRYEIESFVEVGTFTGYTFAFLMGYLTRFNPRLIGTTIDIKDCRSVKPLVANRFNAEFIIGRSQDFAPRPLDLCLIDGDHSLAAVSADFERIGRGAKLCAFHDINDQLVGSYPPNNGGVPKFWQQLKAQITDREFHEFLYQSRGDRVMGLGLLVDRTAKLRPLESKGEGALKIQRVNAGGFPCYLL